MKIYFTEDGLKKYIQMLDNKIEEWKKVSKEIGQASEDAGNTNHDNFEWEQLRLQAQMLNKECARLQRVLNQNIVIVKKIHNPDRVVITADVEIEVDGNRQQWKIGGYNESEPEKGIIAYNTPLAQGLMGRKIGETFYISIAGKKKKVKILSLS